MTRINTNVSSLNAQKSLARSNASLQQALTRLSTGLRINVGKDDPAGLIASEVLRADITSVQQAIANTERANQVIATADSALGQVSSLLNDIRGLVVEAANHGAMSDEQIAANQLQIDSSLDAINRIAQTTTFQGRKLLDGSLDFVTSTTAGGNFGNIADLQIDQANLGAAGSIDVEITIAAAAETAEIANADTVYTEASATLSFGTGFRLASQNGGAAVVEIVLTDATHPNATVSLTNGAAPGAAWNDNDLEITVNNVDTAETTAAQVVGFINALSGVRAYVLPPGFSRTPSKRSPTSRWRSPPSQSRRTKRDRTSTT